MSGDAFHPGEARAHARRASSRRGWEDVFQSLPQPAWIADRDCSLLAANTAAVRLLGDPAGAVPGLQCPGRTGAEGGRCCRQDEPAGGEDPQAKPPEVLIQGRTLILSCSRDPDGSGEVARRLCIGTDITELRRAERVALAQEKDTARRYLRIVGVMIVALDHDGTVVQINPKACEILGCPEEEALGKNWFDAFIPEGVRAEVRENFALLLSGALELAEYHENPVRARGGGERMIAWHNALLRGPDGRVTGTLSSGLDITDRKRAEEDLLALNETLEGRVAERTAMAEERARQLRSLAGELTQAELRERRRVAQILHEHFQQLLAAARIHIGLLDAAALDLKQQAILEKIDGILKESIEESRSLAVGLCPPILYELGLTPALEWLAGHMAKTYGLEVRFEGGAGMESADPNLQVFLFEAVRELLFNVIKHAGVGSARVRASRPEPGLLQIVVRDEGVGLDPERGNEYAASGGFGLFSIRERLESLGGRMVVESAPGSGTSVRLFAPLR